MYDIISAIVAINPAAKVSINAEDLDQITWHDGNPHGITVQQITEKQAELVAQADTDATAAAADKASAKSKLAALGLSEDELSAAFGL